MHRATYCAHNYPLPLLPSGPGGVGGITSRRTRHRNNFTISSAPDVAKSGGDQFDFRSFASTKKHSFFGSTNEFTDVKLKRDGNLVCFAVFGHAGHNICRSRCPLNTCIRRMADTSGKY